MGQLHTGTDSWTSGGTLDCHTVKVARGKRHISIDPLLPEGLLAFTAYPRCLYMGPHTKQPAPPELDEKTRVAEGSNAVTPAFERHFTVRELAALWNLSEDTVRRCFQREPGVIEVVRRKKVSKRRYITLRIPESVAIRAHRRLSIVK